VSAAVLHPSRRAVFAHGARIRAAPSGDRIVDDSTFYPFTEGEAVDLSVGPEQASLWAVRPSGWARQRHGGSPDGALSRVEMDAVVVKCVRPSISQEACSPRMTRD
jgi:hypothetical protein